jgi:DNA-binding PadR family transcriptional regulator
MTAPRPGHKEHILPMPEKKATPEPPSNDLLLAAIDRAERHARRNKPGESLRRIADHLGLPFHSGTSRRLRPQLDTLQTTGLVEPLRHHSVNLLALTAKGRKRLNTVRNEIGALPEAPQHRIWREARTAASERIAGFRSELHGALNEAIALLDADHETDSATWFEFSDRLHDTCWRFASAIHCLHEWQEPDDTRADTDDPPYGQRGRRHTRGWDR